MCRSRLCCGILLLLQMSIEVYCECMQCSPVTSEGWYSELMVCDIGSRNATLMWREDASVSNASYLVIYQVSTRTIRSDLIRGEEEIFTYEINNLTPETSYTVQVCQPAFGTCDQCKADFRTLAATDPSGPPTNLAILASGPTTLTVSWSAPLINPVVVMEYMIQCAPASDPTNYITLTRINTITNAPFYNLMPNTTYDCEVYTTSTFGDSARARESASTLPRETAPGLLFIVSQDMIQYVELTEDVLDMFFDLLEEEECLLKETPTEANITGVDYHFHREELYLTLSNGEILLYNISVSPTSTGTLMTSLGPAPAVLYSAPAGNTLGSITVDWLYDDIYWIEYEESLTKIYRMAIGSEEVTCEVSWPSRSITKIIIDPVHGYMYWSVRGAVDGNGLFRGPLRDFRRSQTLDCPDGAPVQETIFLSPLLLDFVLEPDVFIYFTDGDSLYFIGFDKQNNGSIMKSNQILVESFGEVTVTITPTEMGPYAVMCNATASACSDAPAEYTGADVINDILVFRKSKQPLPAPPSYPIDVRVFTGSSTASVSWKMPRFVESFFGISAYDNWVYCVNYSIIGSSNVKAECTSKLQTTLTSLQNDTFYTFTVSASGPGGERVTPDVFVFRTKSVGSETAKLLISTADGVSESNLDGSNTMAVSTMPDVLEAAGESNGLAHDSRNNLYFWIAFGGQSPLYRFESTNEELSRLVQILDNPVSLAADWVGRRLFWVQDGIGMADELQLLSISMDGGSSVIFTQDPRVTAIAIDSINGRIFWISGWDILMRYLNGLVLQTCFSLDSEPLGLALDVENQYLYWLTFDNDDNTAVLTQLSYTREQCGTSPVPVRLAGSILVPSSRGVLTYGFGTLYLTTVSSSNQSVYVFPADFASIIGEEVTLAFGVIPQRDMVRDVLVVSELLQPLPSGVVMPGLSNISAKPLACAPSLRTSESSTSVIVIEWCASPTSIAQPILYEVDYSLTPFGGNTMNAVKEFTTDTFIQLEDQTSYTEVMVTVTPHTLWLQSDDSLSETGIFRSTPMEPMQVMNVRVYVYHPILDDSTNITALVVWDALTEIEAGGVVDNYSVVIQDDGNNVFESQTIGNESYIIVRDFVSMNGVNNILRYPLESNMMYEVQVFAGNDGGDGPASDLVQFSTDGVRPPQQRLLVTNSGSHLYDSEIVKSYTAISPVSVNTLWRMMYWYNSTLNSVMSQSLDGKDIIEFLRSPPISISTMAYEWQGERLYMAGFNDTTSRYELWRVPVVYSKGLEFVYRMSEGVESVSDLVVDPFRQGGAYWLQEVDGKSQLAYLNLSNIELFQILNTKVERHQAAIHINDFNISALTLNPTTGQLLVSDHTDGGIFNCSIDGTCEVLVNATVTGVPVVSIAMDENMIYWTNGSAINSVAHAAPNSTLSVSNVIGDDEGVVVSIQSLSPGQQPQYWRCRAAAITTCLAPDLVVDQTFTLSMLNPINHTTTTSIEVWWTQPPLISCCAGEVFSFPLVHYRYQLRERETIIPDDPFERHLRIDGLQPFFSYDLFLSIQNIYTIEERVDPVFLWLEGVRTSPGVPSPIDSLDADVFGVTCINVTWNGPRQQNLSGPTEDRTYFVTYSESSSNMIFTQNVGNSMYHPIINASPEGNYSIEVQVSNGVFNSSVVVRDNIQTWPLAPTPVMVNTLNTSFSVMVTLEVVHMDIISLFIQAKADMDGVDGESSVEIVNSTILPLSLMFSVTDVSPFTDYSVRAVATYTETNCSSNSIPGEPLTVKTSDGVPVAPLVTIDSDGIATWHAVKSRSDGSVTSYRLEALQDGEEVDSETIPDPGNGVISYNLLESALNLQVDQSYNICVTARNMIGFSLPGCDLYSHMPPDDAPSSEVLSVGAYTGIGIAIVVLLMLLVALCLCGYVLYKRREKKALARLAYAYGPDLELSNVRAQRYHRTNINSNHQNMWSREDFVATEEELALLRQLPRQYLTLQTFLGQGEFGEVFQGTAFDILGPETGPHPVAIKTFHKGASSEERHKFLSEAALMGKFNHPNIVKILAVCVDNDPVFIIMELIPAGDLLKFLREANPETGPALLTREEQVQITIDIAQGCRYLEQQHFIHRDLAARNCLVSSKGADRIVKIGDFGLAKDLYSTDYYRVEGERRLPVRWMAPEALLQGKFTIESDVWAYGVLLHEVMSFGNQPYPGQSNQDVLQFVTSGGRLPKPDNCPQRIYRLMTHCWRKYASERPRFEEICNILDGILEDMRRDSYCESGSDDGDTLSREGSKKFPSRTPSFKSGFQNLVRSGSKKLRNSLRRHSMHRKEEQTTHTSVSSCSNLIPTEGPGDKANI